MDEDENYILVRIDGEEITQPQEEGLIEIVEGLWHRYSDDDCCTLIEENGECVDVVTAGMSDLRCIDSETETAFVLKDMGFTLQLEDSVPTLLKTGMIAARSDANGKYGVFDLFTGEQLLAYEYEAIGIAGEYLYAYLNGSWTIYQISGPTA